MKNYLFIDNDSGEEFFVQEKDLENAKRVANEYFEHPTYCNICYNDVVAEMLGYDTY